MERSWRRPLVHCPVILCGSQAECVKKKEAEQDSNPCKEIGPHPNSRSLTYIIVQDFCVGNIFVQDCCVVNIFVKNFCVGITKSQNVVLLFPELFQFFLLI